MMRRLLDFDDVGAPPDHPAKGVTVGDIRQWHDRMEDYREALRLLKYVLADEIKHIDIELSS